jgi:hypothetical protein
MSPDCSFEFLDIQTFASRMKISRSTVYGWMQQGVLVEGLDYMHRGRILRFAWSQKLILRLMEGAARAAEEVSSAPKTTEMGQPNRRGGQINWDYGQE